MPTSDADFVFKRFSNGLRFQADPQYAALFRYD